MTTVLAHKAENVTIGVLDKTLELYPDLQSVTFKDVLGAIHTVFSHKGGPFAAVEDILKAHEQGILHVFETHAAAAAFERDRGNHDIAAKLDSLASTTQPEPQHNTEEHF